MNVRLFIISGSCFTLITFSTCTSSQQNPKNNSAGATSLVQKNNRPFENNTDSIIQITFGGQNTYSSFAKCDSSIYFNTYFEAWNTPCDQIFEANIFDESRPTHFGQQHYTYSRPVYNNTINTLLYTFSQGTCLVSTKDFTITLPESADIYTFDFIRHKRTQLTHNHFYDGDATFSPNGKHIVCTSMKTGDPELWLLDKTGKYIRQLTHHNGFDGNAAFSPDGKLIVYVADINDNEKEENALLKQNKVDPAYTEIEIYNLQKDSAYTVINPGKANLHPCFTPDGKHIVFSSNYQSDKGLPFNLYITDLQGNNISTIIKGGTINDYPAFSSTGKYFIFASNRSKQLGNGLNFYYTNWKKRGPI